LLVIPSIPIAVWFSVLYHYHVYALEISETLKACLVIVGVIFVINSLDSLIRLYTVSLKITAQEIGQKTYVVGNTLAMLTLILLYEFTPLKMEWVGLVVIALYSAIYMLLYLRRQTLAEANWA
jgi:glycine betaine transporter